MEKTGIIWTGKTWNPVSGCKQVSAGCAFCYAKTIAEKFKGQAFPNGFDLTLRPHKLNDPYKWKEPAIIFVNSMSDFFWDEIPKEYKLKILEVIRDNPRHEFQILTKRSKKMMEFSYEHNLPDNFWAGVTIENKKSLKRLEHLKNTRAHIKFISAEPLLSDLGDDYSLNGIDWIITGGESGNHLWKEKWQSERGLVVYNYDISKWVVKSEAVNWINNILDKSRKSHTAFFHKQWGGDYPEAAGRLLNGKTYNEMPVKCRLSNTNEYLEKIEKDKEKTLFSE